MSRPTLRRERALWAKGIEVVAGLDEVGRGPLAGPVVAAVVVFLPGQRAIRGLRDSKELPPAERERLAHIIRTRARACGLGAASVREINRVNIRRATALAMRRALARLPVRPQHILIDGTALPELGEPHEPLVDGDTRCQSIAAASVLAKCARDHLMTLLARHYPEFRWERNKGYATAYHLQTLHDIGPTPHHRATFQPVAQLSLF